MELRNTMLNLDDVNFDKITANVMNVQQLSAIAADMGTLTAGTIIGALIKTADTTYPRIEFSSVNNLLQAFLNATQFISISPSFTGSPTLIFETPNARAIISPSDATGVTVFNSTIGSLQIRAQTGFLKLIASDYVNLDPTGDLRINNTIGASGSFTTVDGKTVTVTKGIITSIV